MIIPDFEQKIGKYAELIVKVGLNLQPGQGLIIFANSDVAPLVREVVAKAYENGSQLVSVPFWSDEQLEKIRYQHAPRDSFKEFAVWEMEGLFKCVERGDAILIINSINLELLSGQDPELIATASRASAKRRKPFYDHIIAKNTVQWLVVSPPTIDWATKVFPHDKPQDAKTRLWDAVFKACRVYDPDPIDFWHRYIRELEIRKEYLTAKKYTTLKFTGPDTNLNIGLPENHIWVGGSGQTRSGISFTPNLPTEEVATLPHKDRVEGTVAATKPLSYGGTLIENFSLTFFDGKVVSFSAEKGEAILCDLLEMDENAKFLGEVALVPHNTPISKLDLLFLNTLYDENASNHLALGSALRQCIEGGQSMTDEEFKQAGGNDSLIHVDFMFGSDEMDVDGLTADGISEPIMRKGEWAFEI